MTCLSSIVRAEKQAEIDRLEARLISLEAALDGVLAGGGISSYRFDSGEGSQQVKYSSTTELIEAINFTQSRINRLKSELRGTAVFTGNLRRRR